MINLIIFASKDSIYFQIEAASIKSTIFGYGKNIKMLEYADSVHSLEGGVHRRGAKGLRLLFTSTDEYFIEPLPHLLIVQM